MANSLDGRRMNRLPPLKVNKANWSNPLRIGRVTAKILQGTVTL
jgi:hypothetical protein